MENLREIASDTLGISGAKQGAKDAEGMFYQYKTLGKILNGSVNGLMQVIEPNLYYGVQSEEAPDKTARMVIGTYLDTGVTIGTIILAMSGQLEVALGAKVVYNAVVSKLNRDRVSKHTTSQA
jgi:hypothetical protein